LDFPSLRYFVAATEELNIRRTAERLGISQPSLTRHIRTIEDDLGLDLLIRQRGRVVGITVAGNNYLAYARQILSTLDDAARSARDIAAGKVGRLRLGVCDDATTDNLARILAGFCSSVTGVELDLLELSSPEQANALRRNEIDLGIVATPIDDRDLIIEPLWIEDWHVVFPTGHELERCARISCLELANTTLVLAHPQLAPGGHDHVRTAFLSAGISPRVAVHALRRSTMIMLAASGVGITFVPTAVARVSLPGLSFRPFTAGRMTISAAYRAENPPGLAMQFFRIAQKVLRSPTAS
jgi:DNA-binding transcriptional LysR family regulator